MNTLCLLILCVAAQADEGWTSLFDGKSLKGWTPRGGGVWSVDEGTILGVTGTGEYGWLCSDKKYGDFILEFEAKIEGTGNSGVQVRSRIDDKDLMVGYQFDLDRTRPSTGRLYDEARRKLLQDVPLDDDLRKALKPDDWNRIKISCIGTRLQSTVNGMIIVDYHDPVDLEGILALQVHSGKGTKVRWRNLRIKDLGTRRWEPLWNGKDLEGWNQVGEAEWTVKDGQLSGRLQKRGYAALATAKVHHEFAVRVVFKQVEGKANLSFGAFNTSGHYGSRVALLGGKPQEWNELIVSLQEKRAVVHLNADRIADITGPEAAGSPIALEMVGEGSRILLKSVELLGKPQ